LHTGLRVHRASGISCALFFDGANDYPNKSGALRCDIADCCSIAFVRSLCQYRALFYIGSFCTLEREPG
jgi:hypothetical protein